MTETNKWPGWRYGPEGKAAIFESEADVPTGWEDHPSKVGVKSKPAPAVKTESEPAIPPGTAAGVPAPAKPAAKKAGRPKKAAALDL